MFAGASPVKMIGGFGAIQLFLGTLPAQQSKPGLSAGNSCSFVSCRLPSLIAAIDGSSAQEEGKLRHVYLCWDRDSTDAFLKAVHICCDHLHSNYLYHCVI